MFPESVLFLLGNHRGFLAMEVDKSESSLIVASCALDTAC
jgi:hypothetical protein